MRSKIMPYIFIVFMVSVGIYLIWEYVYVRHYGVFTIAKKVGISKGGKNGSSSIYKYTYLGKWYDFSIIDYGAGDDYVMTKFLVEKPSYQVVLPQTPVPECLKNDSLLGRVWKELPVCK